MNALRQVLSIHRRIQLYFLLKLWQTLTAHFYYFFALNLYHPFKSKTKNLYNIFQH